MVRRRGLLFAVTVSAPQFIPRRVGDAEVQVGIGRVCSGENRGDVVEHALRVAQG